MSTGLVDLVFWHLDMEKKHRVSDVTDIPKVISPKSRQFQQTCSYVLPKGLTEYLSNMGVHFERTILRTKRLLSLEQNNFNICV